MKYLYTFLAGALSMSACVVASNSKPGWMFLLGGILGSVIVSAIRRWSKAGAVGAELAPQLQTRAVEPGIRLSLQSRGNQTIAGSGHPSERERLRTATYERTPRRAPTTKNKRCTTRKKEVQCAMLRPIQQDILSALINLKVPYAVAYQCALQTKAVSFDEAFREAMASVNAGKTRRAAA